MVYVPKRLDPNDPISGIDNAKVSDYWAWAYSDVLENVQRGIYAEFLVALALGLANGARVGWLGYDLKYGDQIIEVKSCAYLQSWPQKKLSPIQWNISKRLQWDPAGGPVPEGPVYAADCFVLSYYTEQSLDNANVLDAQAWHFFVLSTSEIERHLGHRKQLRFPDVARVCNEVTYINLKAEIDNVLRK